MWYQVWLTVLISVDRFYCVRFPLSSARVCTPRRACLLVILLPIASLMLNVQRFFMYRRHLHVNNCTGRLHFKFQWLGLPNWFKLAFIEVFESLFFFVVPLLLLVFLNVALIRSLRVISRRRSVMTLNSRSLAEIGEHRSKQTSRRDKTVTLTLIAVVTAFILFETPAALLNNVSLINSVFGSKVLWEEFWTGDQVRIAVGVCTLFALMNSSTNFFLYVVVNHKFRKDFLQLLSSYKCVKRATREAANQPRRLVNINNFAS